MRTFLSGLLVGAADIVPGISGGTVAFIIGVYEELLASIASFNFKLLFRGEFAAFFKAVRWKFLLTFIAGALFSFISLAKGFQYCLQDERLSVFLYSAFLGLVVGSCFFVARMLSRYTLLTALFFALGFLASYFLSGTELLANGSESGHESLWIIVCGMMAVSAMLLPGISGSYILNIVGMYGPILSALITFVDGLKAGVFEFAAFRIVACMGIGIALGALTFARVVRYLLAVYRDYTLAALVGFMVGALKCVWPYRQVELDVTSSLFFLSLLFFAGGVALVFLCEFLASRRAVRVFSD